MDRNDDMNLDELKDLLSDVPDDGGFDLESIIAEVEGRAPAAPTPEPEPEPAKAAPVHTAEPAREPSPAQTAPKVKTAPKTKAAPVEPDTAPEAESEDPRAARIAAREAKAAEHEQKAAEKRAERRAKREEKLAEREEKQAEKAAAAPKKEKAERVSRKQARAERLAAEQEEENEDIEVLDPDQSARVFRRRSAGLNARSILVLILAAAAAYLSLAPSFTQLPLPSVIDIVANPTLGIGALLLLQLLAMLIGVDIFSMGFSELLHGRPCRETLVSVAIIAAILHSVSLIVFPEQNGVTTPYIAATILLLYAMMREDRARYAARSRSYKAVAQADRPIAVYSHYDEVDDACRAAKGPLFNKNDFLTELERPDTVDRSCPRSDAASRFASSGHSRPSQRSRRRSVCSVPSAQATRTSPAVCWPRALPSPVRVRRTCCAARRKSSLRRTTCSRPAPSSLKASRPSARCPRSAFFRSRPRSRPPQVWSLAARWTPPRVSTPSCR